MSEPMSYPEFALLHCLLEYIPDRIFFKDLSGRFICVSRAEAEYLHVSDRAELMGRSDFDFFDQELAQAAFEDEQRIIRTGLPITGQVERKRLLDGRTGWALVAKIPLRDTSEEIIGTCGISKDITELNPLHPRADGEAVAAGFKKQSLSVGPISSVRRCFQPPVASRASLRVTPS